MQPPSATDINLPHAPNPTRDCSAIGTLGSERLGLQIWMFKGGSYRAYIPDRKIWGRSFYSATLAILDGLSLLT